MKMATRKPADQTLHRSIIDAEYRSGWRVLSDMDARTAARTIGPHKSEPSPPEFHCSLCGQRVAYSGMCATCERLETKG